MIKDMLFIVSILFVIFLVVLPIGYLIMKIWIDKVVWPIYEWVFKKLNM